MTVEGMIKVVYDLLKDNKLNIAKITFTPIRKANATKNMSLKIKIDRCPLCGITLNRKWRLPK